MIGFLFHSNVFLPAVLFGVLLDCGLGEPKRCHPLVGFGMLANRIERLLNRFDAIKGRMAGMMAWLILLLPVLLVFHVIGQLLGPWRWLVDGIALWSALGARSLHDHLNAIRKPLECDSLDAARVAVSRIVSRDCTNLDQTGIANAAIESALENGGDAIFSTLFWFAVAGGYGVILHRLANTLDAMWGYRTERWRYFGWFAARMDDALNYIPARLTALTYGMLGAFPIAMRCWFSQAPAWSSPNAGPVMAAGAGSLGIVLGGPARYDGQIEQRPILGEGRLPKSSDIGRAMRLVGLAYSIWVFLLMLLSGANRYWMIA